MEKDKMIEEMANDLKECLPNDWYWQKSVDSDTYFVAKHFYNAGYRKIHEGSVVFEQKDLTKLQRVITQSYNSKFDVDLVNYLTNTIQEQEQKLKQARKETAEKILKWLKEHCAFAGFVFVETYFREEFGAEIKE